jgi:hypothetical protein
MVERSVGPACQLGSLTILACLTDVMLYGYDELGCSRFDFDVRIEGPLGDGREVVVVLEMCHGHLGHRVGCVLAIFEMETRDGAIKMVAGEFNLAIVMLSKCCNAFNDRFNNIDVCGRLHFFD